MPEGIWLLPLSRPAAGIIRPMAGGHSESSLAAASDEALADRVRVTGDAAAFTLLVNRYRARLIALARRMLGPESGNAQEEAEDVAQEAFVAAYSKRATFRKGESFRPWLYRIAVNRCLDRLRTRTRKPPPADLAHVPEPVTEEAGPLESLLLEERETRLQSAVAGLPPKYRAVFLLRHLDDLSYEEIAVATDLPLGTVKTHLFRARALLREALTGYLQS